MNILNDWKLVRRHCADAQDIPSTTQPITLSIKGAIQSRSRSGEGSTKERARVAKLEGTLPAKRGFGALGTMQTIGGNKPSHTTPIEVGKKS